MRPCSKMGFLSYAVYGQVLLNYKCITQPLSWISGFCVQQIRWALAERKFYARFRFIDNLLCLAHTRIAYLCNCYPLEPSFITGLVSDKITHVLENIVLPFLRG